VQRYLGTARRYRVLIAAILALIWVPGLAAASAEYSGTYESQATIWVLKASAQLTVMNPEDPGLPVIQTVGSQQVELLNQLLQTDSFVRDVVERTSLRAGLQSAPNQTQFLADVRRHFRIQSLGTNMLRISFSTFDRHAAAEAVRAAIAVRSERVSAARLAGSAALGALYGRVGDLARAQTLEAQRQFDEFNASHTGALSPAEAAHQGQLQLALDLALARLNDLKGRADSAAVASAVLEMSGMEFQVVDEPAEPVAPSGGARAAATQAAVALAAGGLLAMLLVVVGTLIANQIAGPADVGRLAPARLFATIPRVAIPTGPTGGDLRSTLAAIAFGTGSPPRGGESR
jgi:hypothetical protein